MVKLVQMKPAESASRIPRRNGYPEGPKHMPLLMTPTPETLESSPASLILTSVQIQQLSRSVPCLSRMSLVAL